MGWRYTQEMFCMEFRLNFTCLAQFIMQLALFCCFVANPRGFLNKKHTLANQMLTNPLPTDLSISLYHSVYFCIDRQFFSMSTRNRSRAKQPKIHTPRFFWGPTLKILEVSMIQTYLQRFPHRLRR